MAKTTFRINEITSPVTAWSKSGTFVPCPSQWADKTKPVKVIITLPDGKEISEEVRTMTTGAGYVPISRDLLGKSVVIRTAKKLPLP